MTKFDTPSPISAVLDVHAGRIQILAADRTDSTVEIRPADAEESRDVQAAERISVSFTGGVLRIESAKQHNPLLGSAGSVEARTAAGATWPSPRPSAAPSRCAPSRATSPPTTAEECIR